MNVEINDECNVEQVSKGYKQITNVEIVKVMEVDE